jgi:glycosyltransferase involved in cell wall biosynthesis
MKEMLRRARFYFYTGTMPAPYTLGFIEALMTGIPIVAIGDELAYDSFYQQDTYEVADLIKNNVSGLVSDDIPTLIKNCHQLLEDKQLAKRISSNGRRLAVETFGKEIIRRQWEALL